MPDPLDADHTAPVCRGIHDLQRRCRDARSSHRNGGAEPVAGGVDVGPASGGERPSHGQLLVYHTLLGQSPNPRIRDYPALREQNGQLWSHASRPRRQPVMTIVVNHRMLGGNSWRKSRLPISAPGRTLRVPALGRLRSPAELSRFGVTFGHASMRPRGRTPRMPRCADSQGGRSEHPASMRPRGRTPRMRSGAVSRQHTRRMLQ